MRPSRQLQTFEIFSTNKIINAKFYRIKSVELNEKLNNVKRQTNIVVVSGEKETQSDTLSLIFLNQITKEKIYRFATKHRISMSPNGTIATEQLRKLLSIYLNKLIEKK